MKIIKQGKSKEEVGKIIKRVRQFECSICGCIFEADDTEYKHYFDREKRAESWECECPNCGELTTPNALVYRVHMLKLLK